MIRILFALLLSMALHGGLFVLDFGNFFDETVIRPRLTAVTVTMFYRQPEPVIEERKKLLKKPEVTPRKKPKPPDKKKTTPPDEPEEIPLEPVDMPEPTEAESTEEPEETAAIDKTESVTEKADEPDFIEDSHGDDVSNMQVVQEAVPLYMKNPPPPYPRTARKRGYQGTVILSVLVNKTGLVENLSVAESSGYRSLDNAAIRAVRDWVFKPAKKADKKVAMWVNVPVRFQLQ